MSKHLETSRKNFRTIRHLSSSHKRKFCLVVIAALIVPVMPARENHHPGKTKD